MAGKTMKYGEYAFLVGILLALIIGVLSAYLPAGTMPVVIAVLFILGIIVGLVNITEKEVNSFLIAAIALLLAVSSWNMLFATTLAFLGNFGGTIAGWVAGFTGAFVAFISPAAFIVALKAIYNLAKAD
jgi:MFS family permease